MDTAIDFVVSEEPFKLMPLEKAPRAERDTALLLYRERMGMDSGMVILPGQSVLSSSVRMGKYDRKIIVDISRRRMEMDMKIKAQDEYCDFLVHIDIEYGISDVKYAVQNNLSHIQDAIHENVRKYMNVYQEKFSIEDEIGLERETDALTSELAKKFAFLYVTATTKIKLDETGQRVHDSNKRKIVDSIVCENESELQKLNVQKENELKNKLDQAKLEKLQDLKKSFGEDALLVNAYLNEEVNSLELNSKIRKQKQEDDDRKYEMFKQLYDMDIISEEFVNSYAGQLLFGNKVEPIGVEETKKEMLEQKDEIEIEDGEEIGSYMQHNG